MLADNGLSLNVEAGWQFVNMGTNQYRYGPSIILNGDGSIDMWVASPAWPPEGYDPLWAPDCGDYIRYRRSTDGGHTWSEYHANALEFIMLHPTPGGEDCRSVCDPGVIKIGATSKQHDLAPSTVID